MTETKPEYSSILGKTVTVTVDRPLGSRHPRHKELVYPINYGYVKGFTAGDSEDQDAYILGVDTPVRTFTGTVIAIVHRLDDAEDKWVVAPEKLTFTENEIAERISFQERYFRTQIFR